MTEIPARAIYLQAEDAIALQYHAVDPTRAGGMSDTAVILCPPFGWEEVGSYRSRREWARQLSAAGHPTVRLSLPGTGNSGGGARDARLLDSWTAAVARTATWLRETTSVSRIAAVGIGLGGLVAFRAVAGGAPVDELVLWATPSRGRALVRQMRAFSRMEAADFFAGLEQPEPVAPGDLEAGGFLLTAETIADLEQVDLAALSLPDPASRRVLLLEQDGIRVEERLRTALADAGVAVSVAAGDGFAQMTAPPQQATPALQTCVRVQEWLDQAGPAAAAVTGELTGAADSSEVGMIEVGEGRVATECEFILDLGSSRLVGTLTEPIGEREPGLCIVFLNAGAIYRMGPNRMWVEAARRWALRGVPSLRLDMEAIGDSDGDPSPYVQDDGLYTPGFVPHVLAALDALRERGVGERFVLTGLCSGAYWSLYATLAHERATAAVLLNSHSLVWDSQLDQAGELRRLRTSGLTWKRIRRGLSLQRATAFAVWMLGARRRGSEVDRLITRIERSDKRVLLVLGEDEPLRLDLELSGRMERLEGCETVTVEYIAARDHTLRPTFAQRQAHAALDRALELELAGEPVAR